MLMASGGGIRSSGRSASSAGFQNWVNVMVISFASGAWKIGGSLRSVMKTSPGLLSQVKSTVYSSWHGPEKTRTGNVDRTSTFLKSRLMMLPLWPGMKFMIFVWTWGTGGGGGGCGTYREFSGAGSETSKRLAGWLTKMNTAIRKASAARKIATGSISLFMVRNYIRAVAYG